MCMDGKDGSERREDFSEKHKQCRLYDGIAFNS
jgi:hypothetical protein